MDRDVRGRPVPRLVGGGFDGEVALRGREERVEGLLGQLDEGGRRGAQAEVDLEEGGWRCFGGLAR